MLGRNSIDEQYNTHSACRKVSDFIRVQYRGEISFPLGVNDSLDSLVAKRKKLNEAKLPEKNVIG